MGGRIEARIVPVTLTLDAAQSVVIAPGSRVVLTQAGVTVESGCAKLSGAGRYSLRGNRVDCVVAEAAQNLMEQRPSSQRP